MPNSWMEAASLIVFGSVKTIERGSQLSRTTVDKMHWGSTMLGERGSRRILDDTNSISDIEAIRPGTD